MAGAAGQAARGSRSPEGRGQGSAAGQVVLIVDDDPLVISITCALLGHLGFAVRAAESAEAGCAQLSEPALVAVLLDLTLPARGSEEVLRAARRLRPGSPVLICSGYTEQQLAEHAGGLAPDGFLSKPYGLAELGTALAACGVR